MMCPVNHYVMSNTDKAMESFHLSERLGDLTPPKKQAVHPNTQHAFVEVTIIDCLLHKSIETIH